MIDSDVSWSSKKNTPCVHHFPDNTGAGQSIQETENNVLLKQPKKIHLEIDEI